ncbi:MAG: T9SS type A sorting domain-containing protein, partial [bacterium]|nr:T9SS type A sorting domain-containing protein [bacterium]
SDGLAKFDGTNWTVFNESNSGLPDNLIYAIVIKENTKWIGTCAGIAKYDDTNWTVFNELNSGLPSDCSATLAIKENNIWIGTYGGGLAVYNTTGVEENSNIKNQNAKLEISKNPFVQSTLINYQLPTKSKTSLRIYDATGRTVKTLVNEEKEAGTYNLTLNAKDLSVGVYFVQFKAGTYQSSQKLILIK